MLQSLRTPTNLPSDIMQQSLADNPWHGQFRENTEIVEIVYNSVSICLKFRLVSYHLIWISHSHTRARAHIFTEVNSRMLQKTGLKILQNCNTYFRGWFEPGWNELAEPQTDESSTKDLIQPTIIKVVYTVKLKCTECASKTVQFVQKLCKLVWKLWNLQDQR